MYAEKQRIFLIASLKKQWRAEYASTAAWVLLLAGCCIWWRIFVDRLPAGWVWGLEKDLIESLFSWNYFGRWIDWLPFPQLLPGGDVHSYPYQGGVLVQPWVLELYVFMSLGQQWQVGGGWLVYYAVFSVLAGCLGSFWLLRGVYGEQRAGWFALLVTVFNFYIGFKQNVHLNISFYHWLLLGVVVDFLLFRQLVRERRLHLPLVMLRGLLLLLGLGHDLSYIAAMNVTSLVLVLIFGLGWVWRQQWLAAGSWWQLAGRAWRDAWRQWREMPWRHGLLLAGMLLVGWLYVPLVLQLLQAIPSSDLETDHYRIFWFANPLRILLPYLQGSFSLELLDLREHPFSGTAGWSLLSLGVLGWLAAIRSRRHAGVSAPAPQASAWVWLLPSAVLLGLLVFNIPRLLPTLQIFPWHHFSRVGGRGTLLYPVLLLLPALEIKRWQVPKWFWAAWLVVGGLELHTFTRILPQPAPAAADGQKVLAYSAFVQQQPGEAIFEWPFCLRRRGFRELCPFNFWAEDIGFLRMYHGKKGLAGVWNIWPAGHLMEALKIQGWPHLLLPEARQWGEYQEPRRQQRCLQEHEYRFLERHLAQHDFAGIQVQEDLLAPGCAAGFYRRFGQPTARLLANRHKPTQLSFVPLDDSWRQRHQKDAQSDPPPLILFEAPLADFVALERPYGLSFKGLKRRSKRTGTYRSIGRERYSLGKTTQLRWHAAQAGQVQLHAELESLYQNQQVRLICNHTPLGQWGPLAKGQQLRIQQTCPTSAGLNELHLEYTVQGGNNLWIAVQKQLFEEGLSGLSQSKLQQAHQRYLASAVRFTRLQLKNLP